MQDSEEQISCVSFALEQHQHEEHDEHPNSTEIVRSIASYLSLSEVESIGSLYSLASPQATAQGYGLGHSFAAYRGTPKILWKNGHGHAPVHGHGHYGSNIRMSPLASIDDDVRMDTAVDGGGGDSHSSESGPSGPDAAAGLGAGCGSISEVSQTYAFGESGTPGLTALSPVPWVGDPDSEDDSGGDVEGEYDFKNISSPTNIPRRGFGEDEEIPQTEHMKRIQENLKNAVFQVPQSIRSYCLQSHRAAAKLRRLRRKEKSSQFEVLANIVDNGKNDIPNAHHTCGYSSDYGYEYRYGYGQRYDFQDQSKTTHESPFAGIVRVLASSIFQNVPLSILFDITYQSFDTSMKVTHASASLTVSSAATIIQVLISSIHRIVETLASTLNPISLLNNILQLQRNTMGMTSESILTGIQSVATGVGSASTVAMHIAFSNSKTEQQNHNHGHGMGCGANSTGSPMSGMASVRSSLVGGLFQRGSNTRETVMTEKMFRKLNKVGPASKVIKYIERDDEVLTKHAKKRIQRIMHYSVPLRPFMATVEVVPLKSSSPRRRPEERPSGANGSGLFGDIDFPLPENLHSANSPPFSQQPSEQVSFSDESGRGTPLRSESVTSSFMSTPKSFPPTPTSRAHVLARGTRFAEDVVFLARDQLRVERGLNSEHAQTRAMARALTKGKRLAVFNASDVGAGINLSCGQHCASKAGNDLYSTARGMIPVLRNSFVYFEMTVSTPPLLSMMLHHASLSIGLSTLEMPLNALVGAWKGSVGLCSTGQLLAGSQWCAPMNPKTYGSKSTVGCLVYLDDDSAFETWDGVMVTANIVFNVDGHIIIPAASVVAMPVGNDSMGSNRTPIEDGQYSPVLSIFVPREEEFFPTLTLHSSQTEVLCRFCAEDILATSRSIIGAPRGVTVYAIDGSVLFHEDADNEDLSANFIPNDEVSCSDDSNTLDSNDIGIDLSQDDEENGHEVSIDLSCDRPQICDSLTM